MSKLKDNQELADLSFSPSHGPSFLLPNGTESHTQIEISDIEMITLHSLTYTSLKDLLPVNPSPSAIMSPTNNSSWYEIPIKNPLVKHAALAYLQPMSMPPESDDRNFFSKLKDKCCGQLGCFAFLKEAFVQRIKQFFSQERRENGYDDDEDFEYDDYEDEKID